MHCVLLHYLISAALGRNHGKLCLEGAHECCCLSFFLMFMHKKSKHTCTDKLVEAGSLVSVIYIKGGNERRRPSVFAEGPWKVGASRSC
uniref:Putative secreted protein n=1 Tax=Ixodes scapularis TaxID=6945 RepID=A0A4D5S6A3_IXOSC